jgi:oxygen-dependent protoporphyrinogen oxidase
MQRIPSSILSLLFSPLLPVMLPPVLLEPFKKANRNLENRDESVDSFFTRRFGATFARTFGSALVHGIYAADSRKLSVRAAFPAILDAEQRGMGSLVRGMLFTSKKKAEESYELGKVEEMMQGVSVYSFRDGMETLTRALETTLRAAPNVHILPGTQISSLALSKNHGIEARSTLPRQYLD